ncbi:hypothetical protein [Moraxella lacunata]|uniref:hypothetical protein n=1 Tax=Moraxella lacunata TaxID=477 RepID=UPI003EE0F637
MTRQYNSHTNHARRRADCMGMMGLGWAMVWAFFMVLARTNESIIPKIWQKLPFMFF